MLTQTRTQTSVTAHVPPQFCIKRLVLATVMSLILLPGGEPAWGRADETERVAPRNPADSWRPSM